MVMAAALVIVQSATMIAPPDPATAASANDLVYGGINVSARHTKALMKHYKTRVPQKAYILDYISKHDDVRDLYAKYGVTANVIHDRAEPGRINSSANPNFKSFGRLPHSSEDESEVVDGQTFYKRPLDSWGNNVTRSALEGRLPNGNYFAILYDCGNLVITHKYVPKPKHKPKPKPPASHPAPVIHPTVVTPPAPAPAPTPAPAPAPTPAATPPPPGTPPPPPPVVPPPPPPPVTPIGLPNLELNKTAVLLSGADGSSTDANGATAQGGDLITYTLTTQNTGTGAAKGYQAVDNVTDILEYADIVDAGGATLFNGALTWPKTTIKAGEIYSLTFKARVKSPIPTRPTSISDPQSYDLCIDNVYNNGTVAGGSVRTCLPVPVAKQIEVKSAALPDTGPATSTFIVMFLIAAISFFYYRNRQLVNEIGMLRGDHHGGV